MIWLIRLGAYALSGMAVWHFIDGADPASIISGRHLVLDPDHGMIFGVCAGFSNFTGMDVTVIRLIWVLFALYRGFGIGAYLLAFLIMPMGVR
ncbi:MAG TPA: PspC domain-containing protein [Selenomonadales bacterium]|nr:PspC domain-containing protein [Selenomonadales bacterium]